MFVILYETNEYIIIMYTVTLKAKLAVCPKSHNGTLHNKM